MTQPSKPGGDSFGIITTCREQPKQVREFVNYHLNLGAACMLIYFDDPSDSAMKLFENEPRVICRPCDQAHWGALLGRQPTSTGEALSRNIEHGVSTLKNRGVKWIASIDADELLYSYVPIAELLAGVDPSVDVVTAAPLEAIQHMGMRGALEFRSCYFRECTPVRTPAQERIAQRYMRSVNDFGAAGCFGHVQGKSLFRASAEADRYGSHWPRSSGKRLRKIVLDEVVLLHFDAINYESWERRWLRRISGEVLFPGMSERRMKQQNHIKQSYDEGGTGGLKRLFQEWHAYSPPAVRALRRAGLVRRIRVPSSRFSRPVRDVARAP